MNELATQLEQVAARDPGSTRLIYAIVIILIVGGLALAAFAWWLFNTTRPDPELLAPLEAIEERRWRRLDPASRRRLLDELRPEGAEPLDPAPTEPHVDDDFRDDVDLRDVRDLSRDQVPDEWAEWDTQLGLAPPVGPPSPAPAPAAPESAAPAPANPESVEPDSVER